MKKTVTNLMPLPQAMYKEDCIDNAILEGIFKLVPHSGGYSKKIARIIQNDVPRKHEERLELIASKLNDPKIRLRWYEQTNIKRPQKKEWSPFYQLISDWTRVPQFIFKSTELDKREIFQHKGKRQFLVPEKIPLLLETAYLAEITPRKMALFLWGYCEAALWENFNSAQFDSESITAAQLDDTGLDEYCSKVRMYFDGDSQITPEAGEDLNKPREGGSDSATDLEFKPPSKDSADSKHMKALLAQLANVKDTWQVYLEEVDSLAMEVSGLRNIQNARKTIQNLENLTLPLKSHWEALSNSIKEYDKLIHKTLKQLGQDCGGGNELLVIRTKDDLLEFDEWMEQQTRVLKSLKNSEAILTRYSNLLSKLKSHDLDVKWEGPFEEFATLIKWLNSALKKGERLLVDIERTEYLKERCKKSSSRYDWNPLIDEAWGPEDWVNICVSLHNQSLNPYLIGICLRKLYESNNGEADRLIEKILVKDQPDYDRTCKILSALNRYQLENLWEYRNSLHAPIVLCVLNSWMSGLSSYSVSTEECWYWEPLNNVCSADEGKTAYLDESTRKFLCCLKAVAIKNPPRSFKNLRRLLHQTSVEGNGPSVASNDLYNLLKKRVLTKPNYGGNYGIIASKAYVELFSPFQEAIKNKNASDAKSEFEKLIKNFDFSKWFSQIVAELSHVGSIESEHKKKIQHYIDDRLICIQQWIDAESQPQRSQDDEQIRLGFATTALLESSAGQDGNDNNFLGALGWWVRKFISTEDIPTKPLSYPNEEFCGSLNILAPIDAIDFPWRGIVSLSNERPVTLVEYLADSLTNWCNTEIETEILKEWQETDCVDYIRIYVKNNERKKREVSHELRQWLDTRLKELGGLLLRDVNEVQLQLDILKSEIKPLFQEEFDDIKKSIESGYSKVIHNRLNNLKNEVISGLRHYGSAEERELICNRIQQLGGRLNEDDDLDSLRKQYESLLESIKERLVHIQIIEKILSLPNLSLDFQGEIQHTINSLKEPEFIPDATRAEMLKYVLETNLTPIIKFLESPSFLAEEVHNLLLELLDGIFNLIKSPEWVVQDDCEVERLLVETSDEIEVALSSKDVERLNSFVSRFSDQCVSIGLPAISKNVGKFREKNDEVQHKEEVALKATDDISNVKSRQNLINAIKNLTAATEVSQTVDNPSDNRIRGLVRERKWADVAQLSIARLHEEEEKNYSDILLASTALALFYTLDQDSSLEIIEMFLLFAERSGGEELFQFLDDSLRGQDVSPLGSAMIKWLYGLDVESITSWKYESDLVKGAATRLAKVLNPNSLNITSRFFSPVLNLLSDLPKGRTWSAEYRACLLEVCFKGKMFGAVKYLLKREPIKWAEDRAAIFVELLERATDTVSWERLTYFLESELSKGSSKPFTLFAERLDTMSVRVVEDPATIKIVDILEKGPKKNLWFAVLEITPSTIDPPQMISLVVPTNSPVRFGKDNDLNLNLKGPFLDQQQVRIELNIKESLRGKFTFDTQCRVKTLQEANKEFIQKLSANTDEFSPSFTSPTAQEIENCFNGFPYMPMHGDDYVPRDNDEKIIVDTLFNAERAGSLWITSPRRSGKTTMLHWVLDKFSYRSKGRDDIILYYSMTDKFDNPKEFNTWIWKRALKGPENSELKKHIPNLEERGISLDKDVDVDIFLSEFAEKLLEGQSEGSRVYFVIDEIDKFAEMHLDGGKKRDAANSIMWQLRNLVFTNNSVGILLAGSHAAQRFFISEASAPFYNSITSIKLTPFNVDNSLNEDRARSILLPQKLRGIYTLTNDSLSHLLHITAGIPYYMKLLAGATFISADHSRILLSDINQGVSSMLAKETGIKRIDNLDNPGEDELRTLYGSPNEIALITAVLLTIANIRSPVSGHPVKVGEIWSQSSPLITRAGLSREIIEPALISSQNMGFIKKSLTSEYQVEFSIPLLGESLRTRFNSLWVGLEPQLMKLVN